MKNCEVMLFEKFGLSKSNYVNYSEAVNAFIGNGYTSVAGNSYFNGLRLLEGILIKEDIGQGYAYTFLNGIKIFHLETKKLLCEKSFHCTYYNPNYVMAEVKSMLLDLLISASSAEGVSLNKADAEAHIARVVEDGFATDQRNMLINQSQKYLTA